MMTANIPAIITMSVGRTDTASASPYFMIHPYDVQYLRDKIMHTRNVYTQAGTPGINPDTAKTFEVAKTCMVAIGHLVNYHIALTSIELLMNLTEGTVSAVCKLRIKSNMTIVIAYDNSADHFTISLYEGANCIGMHVYEVGTDDMVSYDMVFPCPSELNELISCDITTTMEEHR